MLRSFHFIPLHSLPSKKPFSSLGLSPPGAHPQVRAPPLPPYEIIAMACNRTFSQTTSSRTISLLFVVFLHFIVPSLSQSSDVEALLKFKESLKNANALSSWNAATPPCNGNKENWVGVMCDKKGTIWGLKLEHMELEGDINVDALGKMHDLRAISFMNNNFGGSLPDITKLGALKTIYLSNNKFSGEIQSDAFSGMMSLKKIYMSNNTFSGSIPSSLTSLHKLMELNLDYNQFEGKIPSFPQERFKVFNVSHNKLEGEIPASLRHIDASAFDGNNGLCGGPMEPCPSRRKLSVGTKAAVSILVIAAAAAIIAVIIILCRRNRTPPQPNPSAAAAEAAELDRMEQGRQPASGSSTPDRSGHGKKAEQSVKLTFLKEGRERFEMADLLKASAEILGSGVFGSTYKAALSEGRVMVVKRFRQMNSVTKEEFHEHMRRLGRLEHQNLLPLVAFLYRKEEKLLVTEFVHNLSLAVHLHGNKSQTLDWPTRLNIVKGVARGLRYLYNELPSLTAAHGHLKSSNVLLDRSYNPILTDYGLVPVVNQEHAQEHMVSYKSPEYKQTQRITKKTDTWSLGILILEILTGRFPSDFVQQGQSNDTDLTTWVESVMRDNNNNNMEVFDGNMGGTSHCEGEMIKLLKIGLSCCQAEVDARPEIKEVVEKIEEVKERDVDDDFFSSYTSDLDRRSSRGLSDDFNNVTFH